MTEVRSARAHGDVHYAFFHQDDEEIGSWAARCNLTAQETLLTTIAQSSEQSAAVVADRLGISIAELETALSGKSDLTLTEVRLLAIASDLIITYSVRSARVDYRKFVHALDAWGSRRHAGAVQMSEAKPQPLDPVAFGRRFERVS